jgi:hypothetical protein
MPTCVFETNAGLREHEMAQLIAIDGLKAHPRLPFTLESIKLDGEATAVQAPHCVFLRAVEREFELAKECCAIAVRQLFPRPGRKKIVGATALECVRLRCSTLFHNERPL